MEKSKKGEASDSHNLNARDQSKFEIAQELGLGTKIMEGGWGSLTARESGRMGGLITKRERELKRETLQQE